VVCGNFEQHETNQEEDHAPGHIEPAFRDVPKRRCQAGYRNKISCAGARSKRERAKDQLAQEGIESGHQDLMLAKNQYSATRVVTDILDPSQWARTTCDDIHAIGSALYFIEFEDRLN
jgi:hypothetical protein